MKNVFTAIAVSLLLTWPSGASSVCPPGEVVQWIADYCMVALETDDEIAASDCIAEELKIEVEDDCKAKQHYKNAMCTVIVGRGGGGTVDQCAADPNFAGGTVKGGGVGAP